MSNLIQPPQHRWADHIIVCGADSPEEDASVRSRLTGPLPDCYGVACYELRKTAFEVKATAQIAALMDIMCQTMKLRPRGINPARIHILNQSDYRLALGARDDGRTILGHTYIARSEDKTMMAYLLTHELAHLSSYLSVVAYMGEKTGQVSWRRSGYTVQTQRNGNLFTGLNEAAAEIVAGLIRDMLVRRTGLLTKEERQVLSNGYIYAPQVRIVQSLVETISQHEGVDDADPLMSVIYGFLSGDLSFIRRANRAVRGAAAILRAMSPEPASALIAAYALGLEEVYNDIEAYLKSLNNFDFDK